jgi:PAS domain S-box-containing protein
MLGPLEEALSDSALASSDRERVKLAHRNGLRLLRLVNSVLDFSRIEAGRAEASFEPTDVGALTAELASNFRAATARAGLDLIIETPPEPVFVELDRDMWEKIVLNLLSNAFKFTFEGHIRVSVRPTNTGEAVELAVSDTGTGIAEDELPRLFERFHRVEGAEGRSFEGSGIGLALVRDLVKLHGGAIGVRSHPGQGSTFTVIIPFSSQSAGRINATAGARALASPTRSVAFVEEALRWLPSDRDAEQSAIEEASARFGRSLGRVLLADDNADMRGYVQRLLTAEGFLVEPVANGQLALEAAERTPPDLILADVMMPKLDGFGLLAAIRANPVFRDIPVILLSARAGEEARVEGLEAGADDYLTKPFAARELVARVRTNLTLARERREIALRALNIGLEAEVDQRVEAEAGLARAAAIAAAQNTILELAVGDTALDQTLDAIVRTVEALSTSGVLASILVLDADGVHLRQGAAPSLPSDYNAAIDGLAIGPEVGSCGAAAYTRQPVYVTDVGQDPRWRDFRGLAAFHGLRACWSIPIFSRHGAVLGTFAMYHREPREPTLEDLEIVDFVVRTASLVLEQNQSAEAIRASEARYRQIVEGADEFAMVTLDDHGIITTWNRGAERMLGYAAEEAIGQPGAMVFTLEDQAQAAPDREMDRAISNGRAVNERWHVRKDGSRFWGSGLMMPLSGGQSGFLKIFRDRTAEHEAEAAVRRLNETLETRVAETSAELDRAWRLSQDIFGVADTRGYFFRTNPAWEKVLGWTEEEIASTPFLELVHPDDLEKTREALAGLEAGKSALRFENRYRHKDGGYRHLSWSAVPEHGHYYCVARDITEQTEQAAILQSVQDALRQSQKMEAMGQLTGGVAHDFNNLLTPIVGALDLLQRRQLGGEREQRLISGAVQSAERAKTLVQRLLAFARRQPLQAVAVDIGALVRDMADLVASTTGPQIKVVVEAPDDLPAASADPNQLEMALLNLAVNARDAMPEGGTLRISARADQVGAGAGAPRGLRGGDYIRISVADTGAGMSPETAARAIEPFFSTKGIGKGTGLGLSMVHGLASQLGGALTIQSRVGMGTNVELWLPRSAAAIVSRPTATGAPELNAVGTVLLVDDEELVRLSTADMLTDLGYAVVDVASAEDALQLLHQGQTFTLLVTDHLMPGMSGADLAHEVSIIRPGMPVLLVSGYADNEGVEADLPRLTKPFRKDELAASLAEL